MSGTSMDGIDAALVSFSDNPSQPQPELIQTHSHEWPDDIQQALIAARDIPDEELSGLSSLDIKTAEIFADACKILLQKTDFTSKDIIAIGNHGQTIRHRPDIEDPFSLQIGNAEKLAELTDIDVISDFRTADIKAGGQGAPLAPAFHQAVFRNNEINRAIVNIGGISNITVLPKDRSKPVIGFDCGPGNTLMDAWITEHRQQKFDIDGKFAASGNIDRGLLDKLLTDDYLKLTPPKSTGFEYYNLEWLQPYLAEDIKPEDVQRTLCEFTAVSIIDAIDTCSTETDEIYICGGGAHNPVLMQDIIELTSRPVYTTEALGVNPDWVEAMAFAWLAYQNIHDLPGNLPSVTGATKPVLLGEITRYST
jgi:anhydro-N-acetylmuramic acid kinase